MKVAIAVCILGLTAMSIANPSDGEKYTDRYDYININEVLENDVLLSAYVRCCLDKGKCTPEAKELKSHIKDAMQNECRKCTEPQREGVKKVITYLIKHKVQYWEDLKAKYDPTGEYSKVYEKQIESIKA